jgi:hypothetical protein
MVNLETIAEAVARLDSWFEGMRCPRGYCGPVVHWWRDCLLYTGPGLDWRYEGIILGYLNLYEKTREQRWLKKALRAGDDLVRGQLRSGNFLYSSFEANPRSGGTPHEAAVCLALLCLARVLKAEENPRYRKYLLCARRNLEGYYLRHLWDSSLGMFRDSLVYPSFVPNKSATLLEALALFAELTGNQKLTKYVFFTADLILEHQVLDKGSGVYGAVYQMSLREHGGFKFTRKFFPFYVARCVPALLRVHRLSGEEKYLSAAKAALRFLVKTQYRDGSFPQVVYKGAEVARNPQWVAGAGDILRAFYSLGARGKARKTLQWLLEGQDACGGVRTARGFAAQAGIEEYNGLPDFRDLLHVAGWCDKAFRFLTSLLPKDAEIPRVTIGEFSSRCVFQGREGVFTEDNTRVELRGSDGRVLYRWRKGEDTAELSTSVSAVL